MSGSDLARAFEASFDAAVARAKAADAALGVAVRSAGSWSHPTVVKHNTDYMRALRDAYRAALAMRGHSNQNERTR